MSQDRVEGACSSNPPINSHSSRVEDPRETLDTSITSKKWNTAWRWSKREFFLLPISTESKVLQRLWQIVKICWADTQNTIHFVQYRKNNTKNVYFSFVLKFMFLSFVNAALKINTKMLRRHRESKWQNKWLKYTLGHYVWNPSSGQTNQIEPKIISIVW